MLVRQYSRNAVMGARMYAGGAVAISGVGSVRPAFGGPGLHRNADSAWGDDIAIPVGYYPPSTWVLPRVAGAMSWRPLGEGSIAADLIPSRSMSVDMTGAGDLDATAALAVAMAVAMTGEGSLTATITGLLNMSVDLTGSGDLDASMAAFANMAVDLLGAGDLDATIAAYGDMSIDIVVTGTGLSTANVGAAVWSALAAANNAAGTMGEKLNDAGSASNPWTEVLEAGLTAGDFMRLFMAVLAGDAVFEEDGDVVYKALDGSTTRISATTIAGIRTILSRNGS